ncbi:hypothetical protein [Sphaerisporangium album]|uniref:hypothetical protein n=1 Tax=Sphaerisporangium album TaxID=509200 RepID=UPI0015F0488C|nr:hypothetical protein [Sphaerisporangium album]
MSAPSRYDLECSWQIACQQAGRAGNMLMIDVDIIAPQPTSPRHSISVNPAKFVYA